MDRITRINLYALHQSGKWGEEPFRQIARKEARALLDGKKVYVVVGALQSDFAD